MLRSDGKVVLMTGCGVKGEGWGNGKAIDVLLARQGAQVFGCDLAAEHAQGDFEGFVAHRHKQVPMGRIGRMGRMGNTWDVAHTALFPVSDEARCITAQQIVVDGGTTTVMP